MIFEWDERKNTKNKKKHGISFELASFIFEDPHLICWPDDRYDDERWQSLGQVEGVVLHVAHTIRGNNDEEIIRIISARTASAREERRYFLDR